MMELTQDQISTNVFIGRMYIEKKFQAGGKSPGLDFMRSTQCTSVIYTNKLVVNVSCRYKDK